MEKSFRTSGPGHSQETISCQTGCVLVLGAISNASKRDNAGHVDRGDGKQTIQPRNYHSRLAKR